MRKNDGKLVAAQSGASVGSAAGTLQYHRNRLQSVVSGLMAIPVVNGFEVIQIDDRQRYGAVAQCAPYFLVQDLVELAPDKGR